jgi:FtsH-binding integral membrane protein
MPDPRVDTLGGTFGSYLALNEFLGGCFLRFLIGPIAWKGQQATRFLRSTLGAALFGLPLGVIVAFFVAVPSVVAMLGIEVGNIVLVFMLEVARYAIEAESVRSR